MNNNSWNKNEKIGENASSWILRQISTRRLNLARLTESCRDQSLSNLQLFTCFMKNSLNSIIKISMLIAEMVSVVIEKTGFKFFSVSQLLIFVHVWCNVYIKRPKVQMLSTNLGRFNLLMEIQFSEILMGIKIKVLTDSFFYEWVVNPLHVSMIYLSMIYLIGVSLNMSYSLLLWVVSLAEIMDAIIWKLEY